MNTLQTVSPVTTMTSREIAELMGKRHDNVLRDIETQLTDLLGAGGLLKFEDTYRNEQNGQEYRQYRLPKRECLIVVSGYSVELRARIIDRWQELEAQQPPELTREQILVMALESERERLRLAAEVTVMQPKAEFYDHVVGSEATYTRSEAAKLLRTGPRKLWKALRDGQVVQASGMPYQRYFDQGYFQLAPVLLATGVTYVQTLVTAKGLVWIKAFLDHLLFHRKALVAT